MPGPRRFWLFLAVHCTITGAPSTRWLVAPGYFRGHLNNSLQILGVGGPLCVIFCDSGKYPFGEDNYIGA
jgi:hypothetical protein